MSSIQTVWQVPTGETTRGRDRHGVSLDVRWMLDATVCEEKPVAEPPHKRVKMRTSSTPQIRALLRDNPDGLTVEQIIFAVGRDKSNVKKVLRNMPDAYIDRWIAAPRLQYKAIWCVVVPPNHCPRPEGKSYE
jgi:hypothetical protein